MALASIIFLCSLHVNPLIEDYTEVFYIIEECDVVTLQCKMIFGGGPEFTSQVEVLSLIVIAFYVPTLTSRLSSNETSL
jgi:hypothetical protein